MAAGLMWIDASAGVAGDMLLGAVVDAGVPLATLQAAVDTVIPGSVRLTEHEVSRAGLRATKVEVEVLVDDPPHRSWTTIRGLLDDAGLPDGVRARALAAFGRLADAEGRVHGVPPESVHFHEVGALDAIADVVGSCAGVEALGVGTVVVSPVALGSGTIRAHHGELPVPAPATLELSRGWDVLAGGQGELATPTGLALVTSLAGASGPLPALRVETSGVGAGTRDTHGRANVVRVVVGQPAPTHARPATSSTPAGTDHPGGHPDGVRAAVVLEANVDDLDPRLWPVVLDRLLAVGAWDAWLTPILMKKGRPAHTLHVLGSPDAADALGAVVLSETTTLGLRRVDVTRESVERGWVTVAVPISGDGDDDYATRTSAGTAAREDDAEPARIRIKVGHRAGRVVQAMPEFDDVGAVARRTGLPSRVVLDRARAAATTAGLEPGAAWPTATSGAD
ncbi:nickel pincer cofactor biosynthesis protein LarC [Cellulomonas sp. ATA003]|uniref:nickel pincer cofactor biosynthesis protein LarC n=1 Tax=Cellulomonas sp. ATA003 TaxID=3073064 RepID=UPI002872D4CB|nr:nickel pincer cofactor biosynthesis protein LarC [Cellulomonas sp. ATA003]WNB87215.1 nickel pincer cofactor biosynthesis protein LarC [Cellulomonas sp. ATA003]